MVFRQGDSCQQYLFVTSGSVRVYSRAENGREVVLYRVQDNESCTLTTACLFAHNPYPAEGITETETSAIAIPQKVFDQGLAQSDAFRQMIFDQYARRLSDVIHRVEDISFGHIDIRLARQLVKLCPQNAQLSITHQALANELGTAREVISRQLKQFERNRLIQLQRGQIQITDLSGLRAIADSET